ncbi:MAG: heat-shock protein, partial [Dolichospermum sp.]
VKVLDSNGIEVDYFVVFTVFRESKKLRLHIQSAYPKYDGIGKVEKVRFFVIAKNLLNNKKLPTP